MINLKKLEYETEKYLIISVTHSRLYVVRAMMNGKMNSLHIIYHLKPH